MLPEIQTNTLIVGASISGLACAASLQRQGIEYVIIEKHKQVGTPWRNHYDRLHLHTNKRNSQLPYKKFDSTIPQYPSRQQVINYLEDYQKAFNIQPVFNTQATGIKKENDHWITQTNNGLFRSKYLIMATGPFGKPMPVQFKGMETFTGKICHSCEYKTGATFSGQKVLVVGFGNSACEIAIDLVEQGAMPAMAVRSAVNVVPRDVLGLPSLELSIFNIFPPRIADIINAPLIKLLVGDITRLGLRKNPYGPLEQIERYGKAPVLDIGTIKLIRNGRIKILGDIQFIEESLVHFKDGTKQSFDAIVACIGYSPGEIEIVAVDKSRFEDLRVSVSRQKYFGKDGLYFCGYWVSPKGQIREIASDAKKIARDIAAKVRQQ